MTLGTWTRCLKFAKIVASRYGSESYIGGARWRVATCNGKQIDVIERNNTWKFYDPSKGGQPIDKNLVENKLTTKIKCKKWKSREQVGHIERKVQVGPKQSESEVSHEESEELGYSWKR